VVVVGGTKLHKLRDRGKMAAKYRHRVADWTNRAFKSLGEDAKAADADGEKVALSADSRPDVINGTDAGGLLDDVPTEAMIGISVAFLLLAIIVLVVSSLSNVVHL